VSINYYLKKINLIFPDTNSKNYSSGIKNIMAAKKKAKKAKKTVKKAKGKKKR